MSAMTNDALFQSTVPVFRHYIERINAIIVSLGDKTVLAAQLVPDTFTAGEHFASAQGYSLRTVFPLMDREVPDLSTEDTDMSSLLQRGREIQEILSALAPSNFCLKPDQPIHHRAGQADLVQDATLFVTLYALPNFFFHVTMGYATLRAAGVPVGKADFDGQHFYPDGFRFDVPEPS
ncbi:MAG: DUF1993 domain-containing protein [Alphaproteobacteria bacterium]|nr:DUF1993 domain-containing protein [Alphaproteobacteria bacterium]